MTERHYSQVFAVVAAIIEKEGKYLLVKESGAKRVYHDQWNHPAGWLDVGEDPLQGVVREVEEETGFAFTPTGVIGIYSLYCSHLSSQAITQLGGTPHAIKILYAGTVDETTHKELAGDTSEARWFTKEEINKLSNLRDPDILRIIEDFERRQLLPIDIIVHTGDVKKTA